MRTAAACSKIEQALAICAATLVHTAGLNLRVNPKCALYRAPYWARLELSGSIRRIVLLVLQGLPCLSPSARFPSLRSLVLLVALTAAASGSRMVRQRAGEPTLPGETIALAELPVQGQTNLRGHFERWPFPARKGRHGVRQSRTPAAARSGEATTANTRSTPGSRDRGARRIVCGGEQPGRPSLLVHGRPLRELSADRAMSGDE